MVMHSAIEMQELTTQSNHAPHHTLHFNLISYSQHVLHVSVTSNLDWLGLPQLYTISYHVVGFSTGTPLCDTITQI